MSRLSGNHYEVVIIGAGMSGLAAGIRLAMFGKKVLILERHNAPGGLNSFYSRNGYKYDVGLHAMTNYVPPGTKGTALVKLLRQLRLSREDFGLCEQVVSRIAFPGVDLRFSNDFSLLEAEIAERFPAEMDGFRKLASAIRAYDETALDAPACSARERVRTFIRDPLLEDMLFLPLMYYGSATEGDMDFSQFAIMFKALFFEGFARPPEGVRRIIRALTGKFRELGGERRMKLGVRRLHARSGKVVSLELDDGTLITADKVLSSIGYAETLRLCDDQKEDAGEAVRGRLSFVETITLMDCPVTRWGWEDTIVFFNDAERFDYRRPENEWVDPRSGVICLPGNYRYPEGEGPEEGILRVTALANYDLWTSLPEEEYRKQKACWFECLTRQALRFLPPVDAADLQLHTIETDMFTPRTITRYTGHLGGAIYGARQKFRHGNTHLENLFLCGTDQGFLGITGAMLSGISMANLHLLK